MTNLCNKRNLAKALAAIDLTGCEIRGGGKHIEIELPNDDAMEIFITKIAHWCGFRCAYGGWVLRPYYRTLGPDVDFNHVASAHHW